jgi:hypothetical protein
MEHLRQITHLPKQLFTVLVVMGMLCLGAGTMLVETAAANSLERGNLPDSVAKAVLQDASMRFNLSSGTLRIIEAEQRNWSDGCLGLAAPDTMCSQRMVRGWQVRVMGVEKTYSYRTDDSGSLVKLASSDRTPPFPPDIIQ